jgi:hypothetical protein
MSIRTAGNGVFLALVLLLAPAVSFQVRAQQAAPPTAVSILLATPAFYSLPISILLKTGEEYGIKLELVELQGGGEAGAIFASGNGDILASGID